MMNVSGMMRSSINSSSFLPKAFSKKDTPLPIFPLVAHVLLVPFLADIVSVMTVFVTYWVILHRERIDVHIQFLTQIDIDSHSAIQIYRVILEVVEQIVGETFKSMLCADGQCLDICLFCLHVIECNAQGPDRDLRQQADSLFIEEACIYALVKIHKSGSSFLDMLF